MRHARPLLTALGIFTLLALQACAGAHRSADALESWNDTETRQAIVDFVAAVTDERSPDYVPPADRIATFDVDGALWTEQPVYLQLLFAIDRVQAMAPEHPEWKTEEPFRSVLAGDKSALVAQGEKGIAKIVAATHGGVTTDEFEAIVAAWLDSADHPTLGRRIVDCVYQPQLELIDFLHANGFKVFIVSGGGIDFLRVRSEALFGIPPERVVGSAAKTTYELRDGVPTLVKLPELDHLDDGPGKPVGIHRHIGRRPILAVGNSDGDFEMLEWTTAGSGRRLGILVHHTDSEREFAYDRDSKVGRLARGLDEAPSRGWVVVDMAKDWGQIFVEGDRCALGGTQIHADWDR